MNYLGEDKKKHLLSVGFLVLLVAVTLYAILKDNPISALLPVLEHVNPFFLLDGLFMMFFFLFCEAAKIKLLLRSLGKYVSFGRSMVYSFIGFYFSGITPSSSGGQPAQVYFMKKDGINVSYSSLTLLLMIAIYQIVMLLYGLVMFFLKPNFLELNTKGIGLLLFYGVVVNLALIGFFLAVIFSHKLVRFLLKKGARLLERVRLIKNAEKARRVIDSVIDEYNLGAKHFRRNPAVMVQVFVITVFQLTAMYLVPYMVYRALNLTGHSLFEILAMQAILNIAVASLPLPGAAGAAESGFILLFKVFFASNLIVPAMLLNRSISFYIYLLLCAGITFWYQYRIKRRVKARKSAKSMPLPGRGRES